MFLASDCSFPFLFGHAAGTAFRSFLSTTRSSLKSLKHRSGYYSSSCHRLRLFRPGCARGLRSRCTKHSQHFFLFVARMSRVRFCSIEWICTQFSISPQAVQVAKTERKAQDGPRGGIQCRILRWSSTHSSQAGGSLQAAVQSKHEAL